MNLPLRIFRKFYLSLFQNQSPLSTENYFGKEIISGERSQEIIYKHLESAHPCLITRFGSAELKAVMTWLAIDRFNRHGSVGKIAHYIQGKSIEWPEDVKLGLHRNAGFFPPEDSAMEAFAKLYLEEMKDIDILGTWQIEGEDILFKNYFPNAKLLLLECLEPFYFSNPWSRILQGKKVLVIHPFSESIQNQYRKNRSNIFKNKDVLPEFELITYKAVLSNAYNETPFPNWFAALDFMKEEIARIDYDIALIGAGAYGMPLAAFVKASGKHAVHMGGSLQLLFGIRGTRWDAVPKVSSLYNEYWVRPLDTETPKDFRSVENGCYW